MRKLATIRIIDEVAPIPGADQIEKVRLGGWWCVSKKNEFKVGDHCVYCEVDSLLPCKEPFLFLEGKGRRTVNIDGKIYEGYRLRTIKLKGQISQGLALPVSMFPEIIDPKVEDDVSELLGVVKYEGECIGISLAGDAKERFPTFIPKTDEERIQNLSNYLPYWIGKKFVITEKVDGTSSTFYVKDGEFNVCSRNLNLKESEKSVYWQIAKKYDLANKIPEGEAIQGEIVGPGIQKNPLKLTELELRVFYCYNITDQRYADFAEMEILCDICGLKTVPVIDKNFILDHTMDQILEMANRKSLMNPERDAEGIVFRNDFEGKISFKAISNKYLLKGE